MDILDLLIVAGLLVVVGLMLLIFKAMKDRENLLESGDMELASSDASHNVAPISEEPESNQPEPPPQPQRPLTERERLEKMEKELAARAEKAKKEKMRELEERERLVKGRDSPETTEFSSADRLLADKERIQGLIRKAEESYSRGDLGDENFKKIISDYQSQIVELDIKIRKLKDSPL